MNAVVDRMSHRFHCDVDLNNKKAMKGAATSRMVKLIADLESEGLL